jgi:hypothetical protein
VNNCLRPLHFLSVISLFNTPFYTRKQTFYERKQTFYARNEIFYERNETFYERKNWLKIENVMRLNYFIINLITIFVIADEVSDNIAVVVSD